MRCLTTPASRASPLTSPPRTLFEDGYDKSGNRIYDKVAGQTCHQCRQKTLGLRTHCSECQSLHVSRLEVVSAGPPACISTESVSGLFPLPCVSGLHLWIQ